MLWRYPIRVCPIRIRYWTALDAPLALSMEIQSYGAVGKKLSRRTIGWRIVRSFSTSPSRISVARRITPSQEKLLILRSCSSISRRTDKIRTAGTPVSGLHWRDRAGAAGPSAWADTPMAAAVSRIFFRTASLTPGFPRRASDTVAADTPKACATCFAVPRISATPFSLK